ncbi:hypothetical protein BC332_07822 [Capsicum chinense]|nr:hypothetical protein BC332_07822 [Capsicum chinense]
MRWLNLTVEGPTILIENLPDESISSVSLPVACDHYPAVLAKTEKIAKIILLCLQACDFYVKKGIDLQTHPRYKDKESLDMFDILFEDDLPQQPSGGLDCGAFMVMYAECLSYGPKVIATEFDPNALRIRYAALLWDYRIRKQEANVISNVEAPLRPVRQSRITSVTEVVDGFLTFGLPGGLLNFGGNTISPSMLSEIIHSSLCGNR